MSPASTTLAGRTAAEALMVDNCTITRSSAAAPVFDEATGTYTADPGTELYAGKCRVKPRDNADRVVQAGEQPVSLWPFLVSVPITVLDLQPDDLVTVTASALDPDLVGTQLRVRQVALGSHITARRLGCEVDAG